MKETLHLIQKYSSGVSEAVLLSHLQCKWDKHKTKPPNSDPLYFGLTDLRSLLKGKSLHVPYTAVLYLTISSVNIIPSTKIGEWDYPLV